MDTASEAERRARLLERVIYPALLDKDNPPEAPPEVEARFVKFLSEYRQEIRAKHGPYTKVKVTGGLRPVWGDDVWDFYAGAELSGPAFGDKGVETALWVPADTNRRPFDLSPPSAIPGARKRQIAGGVWSPTFLNLLLIAGGGVGWLVSFMFSRTLYNPLLIVPYVFLIVGIVGVVRLCAGKWKKYSNLIVWAGTVVGLSAVVLHCQHCDYAISEWTSEQGVHYRDTIHRASGRHVHRIVWSFRTDWGSGEEYMVWSNGPMIGEAHPKPHGRWRRWWVHPRHGYESEDSFYWYGRGVSEMEWLQLNR